MEAVDITSTLVAMDSVSHRTNEPISRRIAQTLARLGFEVEWLSYVDARGVTKINLVGKRGSGSGGCAYLAHSDVVPADDWDFPDSGAFEPCVRNGRLYGRGSCDMKGSLACALAAASRIEPDQQQRPIWIVCTADEEIGTVGAEQVDRESKFFQEMVDGQAFGIVGEPTELKVVHAHKGGMSLRITSRGRSAHSSTKIGINANLRLIPMLSLLEKLYRECEEDPRLQSSAFDPPTLSWNIVLRNEPQALNITPSLAEALVFFRPMPQVDHSHLVQRVEQAAHQLELEFDATERTPSLCVPPDNPCVRQMLEITGNTAPTTVCYATDGGVLQRLKNLVVCGPGNIAQAHRPDEWISLEQLERGTQVYEAAMRRWSCDA
jgi:acetylornithine deacetylase